MAKSRTPKDRKRKYLKPATMEISVGKVDYDRLPLNPEGFATALAMQRGDPMPPIKVTMGAQGHFQLRDGRHRLLAAKLLGRSFIEAKVSTEMALQNPTTLRPLPYEADALEPVLDTETVRIHHGKHQAAYVRAWDKGPDAFNGSGVYLHELYWNNLGPESAEGIGRNGGPSRDLMRQLQTDFGSSSSFLQQMVEAGARIQGSGWSVLAWIPRFERLLVLPVGSHQNGWVPGAQPLLVIDVWEHAYYLKYQSSRAEYLRNIWRIVNWNVVNRRFGQSRGVVALENGGAPLEKLAALGEGLKAEDNPDASDWRKAAGMFDRWWWMRDWRGAHYSLVISRHARTLDYVVEMWRSSGPQGTALVAKTRFPEIVGSPAEQVESIDSRAVAWGNENLPVSPLERLGRVGSRVPKDNPRASLPWVVGGQGHWTLQHNGNKYRLDIVQGKRWQVRLFGGNSRKEKTRYYARTSGWHFVTQKALVWAEGQILPPLERLGALGKRTKKNPRPTTTLAKAQVEYRDMGIQLSQQGLPTHERRALKLRRRELERDFGPLSRATSLRSYTATTGVRGQVGFYPAPWTQRAFVTVPKARKTKRVRLYPAGGGTPSWMEGEAPLSLVAEDPRTGEVREVLRGGALFADASEAVDPAFRGEVRDQMQRAVQRDWMRRASAALRDEEARASRLPSGSPAWIAAQARAVELRKLITSFEEAMRAVL